jgi:hypothetical protein
MYKNDEPRKSKPGALDTSAGVPAVEAASLEVHERAPSVARVEDLLFEDILDVEGPLRRALAGAVAGAATRDACTTAILGSIESISVRVDAPIGALLRAQAQDFRAAAETTDADRLHIAQSALVDTLAALRLPRG